MDIKKLKAVAYAHTAIYRNNEKKLIALNWLDRFEVTPLQKEAALETIEELKEKELKEHKDKLIFINMWADFKSIWGDFISNHRIRSIFKNKLGVLCFCEVWTKFNDDSLMRGDFFIKNYNSDNEEYNNGLIRDLHYYDVNYTKTNLLELVNDYFNCNFSEIYISDILSPDDLLKSL